jgi:hypothetical protein
MEQRESAADKQGCKQEQQTRRLLGRAGVRQLLLWRPITHPYGGCND